MTEKKGLPQYRCQRCGDVSMNLDHPLVSYNVIDALSQNPLATSIGTLRLRLPHGCDDGGVGLAICIGLLPENLSNQVKAAREAQLVAEEQETKDKPKSSSFN